MFFDLSLESLSKLVKDVALINGAGRIFIVDNNQEIIAHRDLKYNSKKLAEFIPNLQISAKMQELTINNNK